MYIPVPERQALLLRYGLTQAEAGRNLGVAQQRVAEYLADGVGRIMVYLNGTPSMAA